MPTPEESKEILEERLQELEKSHKAADGRIISNMEHELKISEEKIRILENKVKELERKLK
jgi:polyhydroxyalkanoate synthesis regulator phasin